MAISGLEGIQSKLPAFYRRYDDKSILYGVIDTLADIDDSRNGLIDRVNDAIGIDTTHDVDLQYRWGTLLSMDRKPGESYTAYRNRLKMAYPSLVGGTESAIKYAIASIIGVINDQALTDSYINVYDAWEYDGPIAVDESMKSYGNILCIIDLTVGNDAYDMEAEIINAINTVKASGVSPHIFYIGIKILSYNEMSRFTYQSLSALAYAELIN